MDPELPGGDTDGLSDYSSCDGSEFEKYCSANPASGEERPASPNSKQFPDLINVPPAINTAPATFKTLRRCPSDFFPEDSFQSWSSYRRRRPPHSSPVRRRSAELQNRIDRGNHRSPNPDIDRGLRPRALDLRIDRNGGFLQQRSFSAARFLLSRSSQARSLSFDVLVKLKPGEISVVSGIPREYLRRKVMIYSRALDVVGGAAGVRARRGRCW